ncbi:MAG: 16S rRNA (adenine(1518)-N(6)/adenine(1519)-N(6))-dimethyltransferase RsmA [bacterium]
MKAKKKFGQNFLIDNIVLDKISNAVLASEKDLIIEIGPGRGALTHRLVEKKCNVLAYEIDNDLIPVLNTFKKENLKIKNIDFLESDINNDISTYNYDKLFIVGNLPYYITTPIIDHILKSDIKHESLTIMVQLEVANRFLSKPKSKDYGYFTVFLQHFYDVELVTKVKNTSFEPAPKVESAVINLTCKKDVINIEKEYFDFLKICFKEKRKTLKNNLRDYDFNIIEEILIKHDLTAQARAEECSGEVFIDIYKKLSLNSKIQ